MLRSDYIYALFSNNAYKPVNEQTIPEEWNIFNVSSEQPSIPGFYAVSYINNNELVIAYRGSVITQPNDLNNDYQLFLDELPGQFKNDTRPYVNQVISKLQEQYPNTWQDFSITFTGHSLGAALCELSVAFEEAPGICFENPGTKPILEKLILEGDLAPDRLTFAENNVVTYNAAPNYIDTLNEHVGKLYRLYPELDINIVGYSMSWAARHIYFAEYTLQQHQMTGLLNQFNPQTGKPKIFSEPKTWPTGLDNSLNYWLNYDEQPYFWDNSIAEMYKTWGNEFSFETFKESFINGALYRTPNIEHEQGVCIVADNTNTDIWGTTNRKNTITIQGGTRKVYGYGDNIYSIDTTNSLTDMTIINRDPKRRGLIYKDGERISGYALVQDTTNTQFRLDVESNSYLLTKTTSESDPDASDLAITWEDESSRIVCNDYKGGEYGTILFDNVTPLLRYLESDVQSQISTTLLKNGRIALSYTALDTPNTANIYFAIFERTGALVKTVKVTDYVETSCGNNNCKGAFESAITSLTNGGFVIIWEYDNSSSNTEIYSAMGKVFNSEGGSVSGFFSVPGEGLEGKVIQPHTIPYESGFITFAYDYYNGKTIIQPFSQSGGKIGSSIYSECGPSGRLPNHQAEWLSNHIPYDPNYYDIYGKLYNSALQPITSTMILGGGQGLHNLNVIKNNVGGFIVAWGSNDDQSRISYLNIKAFNSYGGE